MVLPKDLLKIGRGVQLFMVHIALPRSDLYFLRRREILSVLR